MTDTRTDFIVFSEVQMGEGSDTYYKPHIAIYTGKDEINNAMSIIEEIKSSSRVKKLAWQVHVVDTKTGRINAGEVYHIKGGGF